MENPRTWTDAERVIDAVLRDYEANRNEFYCGLSLPAQIAEALRTEGLIKESKRARG